jgi:hypothetical protein
MPGGRPPKGAELLDRLDGSEEAKQRLKLVLETMQGKRSVVEATQILGISETRFHVIREKALSGAMSSLEPGLRGRPSAHGDLPPERVAEIEALRLENEQLKEALAREKARADVAEILADPNAPEGGGEKKITRADRRRALKAARKELKKERRNR